MHIGIDLGSCTVKLAAVQDGQLIAGQIVESGFDPHRQSQAMLDGYQPRRIVATGYGRHLARKHFADEVITEIKAHALGARHCFPDCRTIIDVGASTGGFTDCLLQRGAQRIVAVDVGYGQLHWKIRQDSRVTVLERTNIRYLKPDDLAVSINGAVIDVSFISLRLVVPPVSDLLLEKATLVALIKPQFEVGKGQVGKGGVVRDPVLHDEVVQNLSRFFEDSGWHVMGRMASPILGPKGNREFFIYLKR